jgi:hypothetical protein
MPQLAPRDLAIDDEEGDLVVDNGDLVLTYDLESIRQDVRARLRFFAGEWFLNTDEGVPYFENVLVKNPDQSLLRTVFRDIILGARGVTGVPEMKLDYEGPRRRLTVSFRASTDLGLLEDIVALSA